MQAIVGSAAKNLIILYAQYRLKQVGNPKRRINRVGKFTKLGRELDIILSPLSPIYFFFCSRIVQKIIFPGQVGHYNLYHLEFSLLSIRSYTSEDSIYCQIIS